MADRPILFSAPMVRALIAGQKTQTRRIIKPQPPADVVRHCWYDAPIYGFTSDHDVTDKWHKVRLLAYKGDSLWVRETWSGNHIFRETPPAQRVSFNTPDGPYLREDVWFWADGRPTGGDYENPRPGTHMPRWASRLTLIVTDVCVERLQDISEADALAEGITCENVIVGMNCYGGMPHEDTADRFFFDGCDDEGFDDGVSAYAALWDRINGPGAWEANPWIAAYTFRVIKSNIDQIGGDA